MRIALATAQAPFVSGGAELHAQDLKKALNQRGHEAEIVTMPFCDIPLTLIEDHIVAARLMDLTNSWAGQVDLCIGTKFPAYYMPHPNKVIWALHQHRKAYDLYNTEDNALKYAAEGPAIRETIYNADNRYLREAKRLYSLSQNVANRMKKYNNLDSTPLYAPCPDMELFYAGAYEDYILMPSRINATKRQRLAVEALAKTKSKIKLYIVGKADNVVESERLLAFIKECGMEKRIRLWGYVSQEEKFKLYANARAVLFIPQDEDYGYITLEAMASSKPLITAADSGGPLEFIEDGRHGYVTGNTPESIAEAIDELAMSSALAQKMGKQAKIHLKEMNISWDYVVKELTRP